MNEDKKLDDAALEAVSGGMTSMGWADKAAADMLELFSTKMDKMDENSTLSSEGGFVRPK